MRERDRTRDPLLPSRRSCVACGHAKLREATEKISIAFPRAQVVASVAVPARRCDRCGEVRADGAAMARVPLSVACDLADVGVHCGEAFRYMRKAVGLRACDLAALLGVTPETVSHWETGRALPARAAFVALAAMADDAIAGRTTTRDRLAMLARESPPPQVLAVTLREGSPRAGRLRSA